MADKAQQQGETTALAKFEQQFPALVGGGAVAEVLRENLGGEEMSMFDLERVKLPSGGGALWELTDENGEPSGAKAIEGVMVFTKIGRSYWSKSMEDSGGGSPPDCSSPDAIRGIGQPGGLCADCEHAQWGSDGESRGQACKQQRFLFILRPGATLPTVISVPPTSLKPLKQWLFRLAGRSRPYWSVMARFELVKTRNAGGIEYAQIKPSVVRDLTPEEAAAVQRYSLQTRAAMGDYHEGVGEPSAAAAEAAAG